MKLSKRQAVSAAGLVLVIFAVLALVYRDFVRENIVVPIYYLFWWTSLLVNAIPQVICLIGATAIGLLLSFSGLRNIQIPSRQYVERRPRQNDFSRYQFWLRRCSRLNYSMFFRDSFYSELRRLILVVLADQEHCEPWEAEKLAAVGSLDVPPEVIALIVDRGSLIAPAGVPPPNFWERLWAWIIRRDALRRGPPTERQIENIIAFLEKRLEVDRDRNNR